MADPRNPHTGERQTGYADHAHKEGFHFETGNGKRGKSSVSSYVNFVLLYYFFRSFLFFFPIMEAKAY